jgi:hypothetical protein
VEEAEEGEVVSSLMKNWPPFVQQIQDEEKRPTKIWRVDYMNGNVMFLLVDGDEVPFHIRQTFGLNYDGKPLKATEVEVVREKEKIPDDTRLAVIMYNDSSYHLGVAHQIKGQIEVLHPRAAVFMFPIKG